MHETKAHYSWGIISGISFVVPTKVPCISNLSQNALFTLKVDIATGREHRNSLQIDSARCTRAIRCIFSGRISGNDGSDGGGGGGGSGCGDGIGDVISSNIYVSSISDQGQIFLFVNYISLDMLCIIQIL